MNNIAAIVMATAASMLITAILGFVIIPWLKKLKFGQTILEIGPKWHKSKEGTPTMGGIMFAIGTIFAIVLVLVTDKIMGGNIIAGDAPIPLENQTKLIGGILIAVGFGILGFMDDYIKVVKKRNEGLTVMQKTIPQLLLCLGYLATLYMGMNGKPYMFIPFVGNIQMGWFFWIFGICVIYATVNSVNFTDGLDGLCSSVTVCCAIGLGVIAALRGLFGVSMVAAALAGGCVGFLFWNRYPAKVIMGDTGSMFLGGMVVALAYAVNSPIILVLVGIIYVIEGLSDVLQIGYFKLTHGKRIFKMAPIHHHFEMSGWSEKKIVKVFTFINILGAAAGVAVMYFG